MFGWIKKLFSGKSVDNDVTVVETSVQELPTKPETVSEPSKAPKAKKPAAKKKAAPKKKTTQPSIDLESMTKTDLDIYARKELGLKLSKSKTKAYMIEQIQKHIKEK
jgi:hypothetical protein